MPLFYQHTINGNTELGVWQIQENEQFFLSKVPLRREISHPHKRLQHLAGRYLLQHLFPDFPYDLIEVADTRKPFLTNEAYHFSISHCGDFAAAIVSRSSRVGVDIEEVKPMIEKIRRKFLSDEEALLVNETLIEFQTNGTLPFISLLTSNISQLLTLVWSAKEAIYKWHGIGGLDFKKHIQLKTVMKGSSEKHIDAEYSLNIEPAINMNLVSRMMGELVLTYVITLPPHKKSCPR